MSPKQHKLLKILAYSLVFLILVLSIILYYEVYKKGRVVIYDFIENPEENHGYTLSIMGPYGGSFDKGFYIIYNQKPVKILYGGDYIPPRYGEVLVYGTLQSDGYVKIVGIHNYDYNYFLYAASFLSFIVMIIFFLKEWRITLGGIKNA